MRKILPSAAFMTVCMTLGFGLLLAQNPASNKAFFASDSDGVDLGMFDQACTDAVFDDVLPGSLCSAWNTVFWLPEAFKTSNNGAGEAAVSLECAIWTYNTVTATSGGGKKSSSARAGIEVQLLIDGEPATPGTVIFCDRLQAVGLQVESVCSCTVPDTTCSCTVEDTITLELFQRTKNAHSFHFFEGPLGATLHDVHVRARGIVACTRDGAVVECSKGTLDAFTDAQTTAAIGKATLVLDEHNNWGSAP